ncbi:MAG: hypothetical protein WCF23_06485 [Candidatus Nitrosopolaris sp.]
MGGFSITDVFQFLKLCCSSPNGGNGDGDGGGDGGGGGGCSNDVHLQMLVGYQL